MKIRNYLFSILLLVGFACIMCLVGFSGNKLVYADDMTTYNLLDSVDDNLDKDYLFKSYDGVYSNTFNGNGYTLQVNLDDDTPFSKPLFESLNGATIKNLKIKYVGPNTCFSFKDKSLVGIIAGNAINTTFENIEITGLNVKVDDSISSLLSVGIIAGKASSGTVVKNCYIHDCKIEVNANSNNYEKVCVGGIVGLAEGVSFSNNIVNFYSSDLSKTIVATSNTNCKFVYGGLAGETTSGSILAYNNVFILDALNISYGSQMPTEIGSVFGCINQALLSTNLYGFLTTYANSYFGNTYSNNQGYNLFRVIDYVDIQSSIFSDTSGEYWCDYSSYEWDYENIWMESNGKFPILQCFQVFSVNFSTLDSIRTLNISSLLNSDVNSILEAEFSCGTSNIRYGSNITLTITLKSNDSIDYNSFFKVKELWINGKFFSLPKDNLTINNDSSDVTASDVTDTDETGTGDDTTDDTTEDTAEAKKYVFEINNFNANHEGSYYVVLEAKPYIIGINVENNLGQFMINSEYNNEANLLLTYGQSYTIKAKATARNYSDNANWIFGITVPEDNDLVSNNTENYAINKSNELKFTFAVGDDIFDKFFKDNIKNYSEENKYNLTLVFLNSSQEVKIFTVLNDGTEITDSSFIEYIIDNSNVSIYWNEAENCFYSYINYDGENHTIEISGINGSKQYKLYHWDTDFGTSIKQKVEFEVPSQEVVNGDNFEAAPINITCVLMIDTSATNLLWLWISIGGVVVAGVIVLVVILLKRRGPKTTSYKKYYY